MLRDKHFLLLTTCLPVQAPSPACPLCTRIVGRHFQPGCAMRSTLLDAPFPPPPICLQIPRLCPNCATHTKCLGRRFRPVCVATPTLHDKLFLLPTIFLGQKAPPPAYAKHKTFPNHYF